MRVIFHADDFGVTEEQSVQILDCAKRGLLNSLSIMPNSERAASCARLLAGHDLDVCVHLNLTEGKPVLPVERVPLLVDADGYFNLSFVQLFLKSRALRAQVRDEFSAQIARVRGLLPEGTTINIDSHQHVHMIPRYFRIALDLLGDDTSARIRLTNEPIGPFVRKPQLWKTYRLVNWVKVFLLKVFSGPNKRRLKARGINAPVFFGVLMTGHMDAERVGVLLSDFKRIAQKRGRDLEVLFHPGRVAEAALCLNPHNVDLVRAQLSENHQKEHDALIVLKDM